ncbi:MAG: hypothetical protein M0R05_01900 [Bacilli bacterium]|nr:hypothetical protein [Bacilli bacterium]
MKRRFMFLLVFVLFLFGFAEPKVTLLNNIAIDDNGLQSLKGTLASLTTDLLPIDECNPIFSPLSLYLNLSMLAETVDDEVKTALFDFISINSIDELRDINRAIVTSYTDKSLGKEFRLRNFLFRDRAIYQEDLYNEDLITQMKYYYSVYDEIINLWEEGPTKISQTIKEATNNFLNVSKDTINQYLHKYSVNVFMNVIYFDDEWQEKFKKSEVGDMQFFNPSEEGKTVKGLIGEREGMFHEDDDYILGSLDFNQGCRMYFILPHKDKTIEDVFRGNVINDLISKKIQPKEATIDYKIPKFDINYQYVMTEILKTHGLDALFGLQEDSPFYYGDIYRYESLLQSSRIMLDEAGVKAATATLSFGCGAKAAPPFNATIHLERPFIYLIVTPQDIILFSGIVNLL